jgi:signal transduction histidine kinase
VTRRLSLRAQLLLALVIPAGALTALVAARAEAVAGRALEAALAERLVSAARAAAAVLSPRVQVLGPGDDATRTKRHALEKLRELRVATRVARFVVVRSPGDDALLDTDEVLPIGAPYRRAAIDRLELERVAGGRAAASVLFEGPAGRTYKTGYAPFRANGEIVGYVAAAAPATYADALTRLRERLVIVGGAGLLLLVGAAALVAALLARPLADLSRAARAIGGGALDTPIPSGGAAEAVVLADTMRSMAASLRARDEEMQMMLAGIAHEVRNPLGGIELFGGILKEDLAGDPREAHVDKILRELGALSRVVNDFLDFARNKPVTAEAVDLADFFFELAGLLEGTSEVKLRIVPPEIPRARFDRAALRRALVNLVQNGLQAARREVQVRALGRDGALELFVDDDGPGIPAEIRDRVTAPFFTTREKGTGLGLALAERTASAHGGELRIDVAPLGGARVGLVIPGALPRAGGSKTGPGEDQP